MDRKELTNRRADKVPLKQSKQLMWSYIQKKTERKPSWFERWRNYFRHHTLSFASVTAVVLILAIVSYNFPFTTSPVVHASFEMEANQKDSAGIEPDTSFTLTASTELSTHVIEEVLKVEPSVDLEVKKLSDKVFEVIPADDLEPNQIYQFSIMSQVDGQPQEFSWAYQVKDTFKVMSTVPGDKMSHVDGSTGIEIRFSHENFDFESIENYFEISPEAPGRFEKHRQTLSFVPQEGLNPGTIYTITLKKGFTLKGAEQVLLEDYQFQFETGQAGKDEEVSFQRKHYEVAENTPIGLSAYKAFDSTLEAPIKVNIYQFPDLESYLSVLRQHSQIPTWSQYAIKNQLVDVDQLKLLAEAEAIHEEKEWQQYLYLPTTELEKGYYLFEIQNPNSKSQALIQVTNLSAYLDITETDTLLWANDLKTGQAVPEASVEILDQAVLGKTNQEGVARFKTPDALRIENEAKILKITSQDEVLIRYVDQNYGQELLESQYWYSFSTDRPIYKETDTLHFWGVLKPKNTQVTAENLTLTLSDGNEALIEKQSLERSKDGMFKGSFSIEHVPPGYYYLILSTGEKVISRENFQIQNYVKPAYQISIDSKQEAVFAGDQMHFDIRTQFFDGTPVPNLDLLYTHDWESGDIKTNQQGELSMAIEAQPVEKPCGYENNYCINEQNFYLSLSPQFAEASDIEGEASVLVFNSKVALKTQAETLGEEAKLSITAHEVDLQAYEETGDYFGNPVENKIITGQVTELSWKKEETGEYYDFINKKVEKTYSYEQVRKTAGDFEVKTNQAGIAEYVLDINPKNHYEVLLTTEDEEGQKTYETVYVYGGMSHQYDYYNINLLEDKNSPDQTNAYDIGDHVKAVFANDETPLEETEEGKFLFLQSSNGLQEYSAQDESLYEFEYEKNDIPNVYISGVWFTGQNYVVAESTHAAYKKELKELLVKVEPNEAEYQPGGEVELSVLVTDKDGQPVQAEVNLNLVDEAYYQTVYAALEDPLNDLYRYNDKGEIFFSSSHDSPLFSFMSGDKGGCFVAGTRILMGDGSYKNIEDIEAGDFIQTKKNPLSAEMVKAKVLSTVSHQVTGHLVFNDDLRVTPEHVLFVNGQFQLAGRVKVGDRLLNKNGGWVTIHSISEMKKPVMVYNFEVENQNTYFANDFYVHNDKGGDGIRSDFEDTALFETVQTNSKGVGEIKFQLPDNITSWRVVAKAIDSQNLQAGMSTGNIPVSLPLFADLIVNSQYSIKDKPIIKFRAYGDALQEGDDLDFHVSSTSLNFEGQIQAQAYQGAYHELPQLSWASHEIVLKATAKGLQDALSKSFDVVGSRLSQKQVKFIDVLSKTNLQPSKKAPTQVTFVDGGRGQYYNDLMTLYSTNGDRLDQRLASVAAQELFQSYFNQDIPLQKAFEPLTYQSSEGGLRLIPYADTDLELTALTLILDDHPERFNQNNLKHHLYDVYQNKEANLEEIVWALAGLAALNEPVLTSLELIQNEPSLTVKEKLYIALAFEALGAKESALVIHSELADGIMSGDEQSEVIALAAVLAAALNEEQASKLWELALKNQQADEFLGLHHLAYVKHRLKFAESQPVTFKLVKNNQSETIRLENGNAHPAFFLPDDEVEVEVLEGRLSATLQFSEEVEVKDFINTEGLEITRNYSVHNKEVDGQFNEGDLVKVTLTVSADEMVKKGNFRITDILPSGLIPVTSPLGYISYGSELLNHPYLINGQEVNFYWHPQRPESPIKEMASEVMVNEDTSQSEEPFAASESFSYLARVVNPGQFYADPAKVELFENPEISSISDEAWVEILKGE